MKLNRTWRGILSVLTAVIGTLFLAEIGYRFFKHSKLKSGEFSFFWVEKPLYVFDQKSGFKYAGSRSADIHWLDGEDKEERRNRVEFNRFGQRSQSTPTLTRSYPPPNSEYRIAVIGDSLSACIHNDLPWSDLLEKKLNRDKTWLAQQKVRSAKVINFSRDGIGLEQFPAILHAEVEAFRPDLILVNFITADIYRRFVWRKSVRLPGQLIPFEVVLNCTTLPAELSNPNCSFAGVVSADKNIFNDPENRKSIREAIASELIARVNWFSAYPELLNLATQGKFAEWLGKNPFQPLSPTYESSAESLLTSAGALKLMNLSNFPIRFLHLPVYWELIYSTVPKLVAQLQAKIPEIKITSMLPYFPDSYAKEDVNHWTFFPLDMHFSNSGVEIYAEAVHAYLKSQSLNKQLTSMNQ